MHRPEQYGENPSPIIQPGEAKLIWLDAMITPPIFISFLWQAHRAIEIATKARIGGNDCVYVAISEKLNRELLTADKKLAKNLPQFNINLHLSFYYPFAMRVMCGQPA
jgi:hypothetical protein